VADRFLLETAWFREVAETARDTLEMVSSPSLAHLKRIRDLRDDLDRIEAGLVAILREDGATWESLAVAAGVTRQSLNGRVRGRANRWVDSVRAVGTDDARRTSLLSAWNRVVTDLQTRSAALAALDTTRYSNLGKLPLVLGITTDRIDVKRRTSPSRTPR
jgi:hypothetical protein